MTAPSFEPTVQKIRNPTERTESPRKLILMSAQYLLPCPDCENKVPVNARQAGAQVTCPHCNTEIEVPTLGRMKQYQVLDPPESDSGPTVPSEQNRLKGLLFAGGLILAVLAGAAAGGIYSMSAKKTIDVDVESEISEMLNQFDQLPVANLYDEWMARPTDLGEWKEFEFVKINKEGNVLRVFSYVFMGLAAIGLLMIGSSFMVGSPPQAT